MKDKTNSAAAGRLCYRSPKVNVIEVKVQNLLCYSPIGETNATEMEEGDQNW